LGESYTGIRTLADFSAIVIYTNWPSGVVAYLVATLESANKLSGAVARDINLVVMLVSDNTCGFIAQQCSVLASLSLMMLFIAKARPRVGGKSDDIVTTWSRGPVEMCTIKGDDFTPVSRRLLSLVHQ
jgi:hypothetical protein